MTSKVLSGKVCPPSLGTSAPTVRTLDWSRPMGFYRSLPGYHTPKCATYVFMQNAHGCGHVCYQQFALKVT